MDVHETPEGFGTWPDVIIKGERRPLEDRQNSIAAVLRSKGRRGNPTVDASLPLSRLIHGVTFDHSLNGQ